LNDSVITLLGIYLKECKSANHGHIGTFIFITTVVSIVKLWNKSRSPSANEKTQKMWYIYTVEYYLVIKKIEIMSFKGKWMELEIFMLSKISQTETDKYHMFSFICGR
jgi:hypothetical protein